MRTPLLVTVLLLAVLVPIGFATEEDEAPAPAARAQPSAPIAVIARRVEALRGLRYERRPEPKRVTPAQAKREGLADFDRFYPEGVRQADEEIYKLLGLIEPGVDLRDVTASIFGEQVAGYYDPRTKRLRIVQGAGTGNRVVDEMVTAHELVHALEDQAFGLDLDAAGTSGDRALAYSALVEGTATASMYEYVRRHFRGDVAFGGLLGAAFAATGTTALPPFLMDQLSFPYVDGERFVERLYRTGGRTWRLVDAALRFRPPASTEQVLHPEAYLRVEQPVRVRVPGLGLGPGWRRAAAGTFGEWQTRALLRSGGGTGYGKAAAGWGGDRYELWRRGGFGGGCAAPCRPRDVLVLRWEWDRPRDAREVLPFLRRALPRGAALRAGRETTTLVVAPTAAEAARLARRAAS